jgi:N-acetylglutamate synthase-like GNAT family acetyltransferase
MSKVERIYLMTTHQQSFYERIGFAKNGTTTMVLHQQDLTPAVSALAIELTY